MPAIHTVELSKKFGGTVALAGLSMTVPRGEVFGFLGPNGAGKTTSVKLLLGLIAPSSGEGWLLGKPIGDLRTRRKIGYLPELFRYQAWLSAREVLALHCELAPLPRSSRSSRTGPSNCSWLAKVHHRDRAEIELRAQLGVSENGEPGRGGL